MITGIVRPTVVLLVSLLAVGALSPVTAETTWRPKTRPAIRWSHEREGSVSFAVKDTKGRLHGHRAATTVHMASTLKVMFMVAYLRRASVRGRKLRASDKSLLRPMIRWSDNDTATRIADLLGPRPMYRLARKAKMKDFSFTRPWGLSSSSARDQARFMFKLERYIPKRHRGYARWLLAHIVKRQRWGIGDLRTRPWRKFFKGGWGSGTGAVNHQIVLLEHKDGTRTALAVMTTNSPSHAYGKRTLKGVFARLLRNLP
ncbi:MAG: serine hydrolase [Actinomycetota bacterium]